MIHRLAITLFAVLVLAPSPSMAQSDLLVLVLDPGETRLDQVRLQSAIERSTGRSVIRLTDARAPAARGRLTIAFSRPDRWVLRYEAGGQVAWVSDRITRPGELRERLATLSHDVVNVVDDQDRPAERSSSWEDDVIHALQDEIIDPFSGDPPRQRRPVTVLWSEVVDPFTNRGPRAHVGEVWSEVLDPWAGELRRRP